MTISIRRVVTGHDENGKPIVRIDDIGKHTASWRPNFSQQQLWTTTDLPVQLSEDNEDKADREVGTTIKDGSIFKVVEFAPGVTPRIHRTDSIDYAIVLSGEIDMEMDETVVHLRAGDALVQRATIHNWVNNGTVPCVIAFVLISAEGDTATG